MPVTAWIALGALFVTISVYGTTFAYFLGRLSQRVQNLERDTAADASVTRSVVQMEVEMKHVNDKLESLERSMQGVQRQLGNLATGHAFKPMLTDQQ